MMISLRQLRYLDALRQHGHFGRAAEACGVTQPALSMQLRDMERTLGLELVARNSRSVSLTPAGEAVAERAARILAEVRDLEAYARHHARLLSGTLRLGIIPTVAPYLLPPALPLIRSRHPDLDIRVRETQTAQLLTELRSGMLDVVLLAFGHGDGDSDIERMPLMEDRFLLALPPGHPVHRTARATPELLNESRLLLLEEGHCLREQALEVCELRRSDSIDMFGATSLSTLVQMVANGLGLTLLPEIAAPVEGGHGVRLIRFAPPEPSRTLGLAWRAASPRGQDYRALGALVVESRGAGTP